MICSIGTRDDDVMTIDGCKYLSMGKGQKCKVKKKSTVTFAAAFGTTFAFFEAIFLALLLTAVFLAAYNYPK